MLACVCRLIFRGDPCIILGSDILSVSMSAPRYPSEMKKPDTVPCNNALNLGQWGFSITPQMEPVPLHTIKKRQHYVSTVFKPENKWTCFCTFSRIWNHISAVCQRLFEVFFFFLKKPSEVHLHDWMWRRCHCWEILESFSMKGWSWIQSVWGHAGCLQIAPARRLPWCLSTALWMECAILTMSR